MNTRKTRALVLSSFAAFGVLALLMLGLLAGAAQAEPLADTAGPESTLASTDAVTPGTYLVDGNPNCENLYTSTVLAGPADSLLELGPLYGFKYDANPTGFVSSTIQDNDPWEVTNGPDFPDESVSIFNVLLNDDNEGYQFDWSATLGMDAVIVKASDAANAYVYSPEAFGDMGLQGPEGKGISHVEFCYDYEEGCADLRAFKYLDGNQDGNYDDPDEAGLDGWVMKLISPTTSIVLSETVTTFGGYADFGCVVPGTYSVCETLKPGYINSDPGPSIAPSDGVSVCKSVTLEAGDTKTVRFGNYEPGKGTKEGRKFHDLNGNGQEDEHEPGLEYWEIDLFYVGPIPNGGTTGPAALNATSIPSYTEQTDSDGQFGFQVEPGCYHVCEVLKPDWIQSKPISGAATSDVTALNSSSEIVDCSQYDNGKTYGQWGYYECIGADEVISDNVFGNYFAAIKKGQKYEDDNGNGEKDAGEPGLPKWTINLVGTEGDGDTVDVSTTTDPNGYYSFTVSPGTYTVTEECPLGGEWRQSEPGPMTSQAGCGDNAHVVTLRSQQVDDDNNFGNFKDAVKSGMKFHDVDHSGGWTTGDELIEGWWIYLDGTDGAGNALHEEMQTNANGVYSFTVPPGSYVVCEELPADWDQTFPSDGPVCSDYGGGYGYAVELASGDVHPANDFGNDPKSARVRACKYNDLNGDGDQDRDEPPLSGWEICLGDDCKLTQAGDGCTEYWPVAKGSSYSLCEEDRDDWVNTDPGGGTLCKTTPVLEPNGEETVRFGNYQERVVGGTTFTLRDAQGVATRLGGIALAGLLVSGASLILWRRKANRR